MRVYSDADEKGVRLQANLGEWARSGLLDTKQAKQLEAEIGVDLRRTGFMLRVGLAFFTFVVASAGVALMYTVLSIRSEGPAAAAAAFAAVICFAGADALVRGSRFYRHGVEEMLAISSVALVGVACALLVSVVYGTSHETAMITSALVAGAAAALLVYLRFGLQYAAVGAMVGVALIPFQFEIGAPLQRLLATAVFAVAFGLTRRLHLRHGDEYPGDEGANLQAAAFLGAYLSLNMLAAPVFLSWTGGTAIEAWFRWSSYAATWILPALGLLLGIRTRDRRMLDVSLVAALVTFITSKPYLGWPRQPWDPMLFGVLLAGVAVIVRRWLASGSGGEYGGFTPLRVLARDADAIRVVSIASTAFQPAPTAPAMQDVGGFQGGRSGGGGGGADF